MDHLARSLAATLFCLIGATAAASAASLENIVGTVRVNRGTGYQVQQGSSAVRPGDMIFAAAKSEGSLVYSDGCRLSVLSDTLTIVEELSPCSMTAQAGLEVAPTTFLSANAGFVAAGGAVAVAGAVGGAIAVANANAGKSSSTDQQRLTQLLLLSQTRPSSP